MTTTTDAASAAIRYDSAAPPGEMRRSIVGPSCPVSAVSTRVWAAISADSAPAASASPVMRVRASRGNPAPPESVDERGAGTIETSM